MITPDILMEDLVSDYPQVVPLLVRRGVVCIQCGEPVWGTLGEAIERAGLEDREFMLNELDKMTAVSK